MRGRAEGRADPTATMDLEYIEREPRDGEVRKVGAEREGMEEKRTS